MISFRLILVVFFLFFQTVLAIPYYLDPVGYTTIAFDSFRSVPEGGEQNNNGALIAVNFSQKISSFLHLRAQVGASFGIYDWGGRGGEFTTDFSKPQQQFFLTSGLFTRTCRCSGVNGGCVFDYMWNQRFGVFALNPNLGQFRGQIGYFFRSHYEIGLWATARQGSSRKKILTIPITFRAINQVNCFWAYHFQNESYLMISGGVPYGHSLLFNQGKPGRYILGGRCSASLSKCWSLTGYFSYMTGRNELGPSIKSTSDAYNVCISLTYFFGGRTCRQPYLPLADNSNFLIDTNMNQLEAL